MAALSRRSGAGLAAAFVSVLAAAGCTNPFQPAQPQQPGAGSVAENFSWPDSTLATIRRALAARGQAGMQAYLDALADSASVDDRAYYAFFDPAVLSDWTTHGSAPDQWPRDYEQFFFQGLSNARTGYKYDFNWWTIDQHSQQEVYDDGAGDALLHRFYTLVVSTNNVATPPDTIAQGYADFSFVRQGGRWVLYRWQDRRDPTLALSDPVNHSMTWYRLNSLSQ